MSQKFDVRQTKLPAAQSMIGSSANDTLDSVFPKINDELAKLLEDRNLLLTGGGTITNNSSGTSVTFSANFVLYVNQNVAGAAPYAITLGTENSPLSFSFDGNMAYIVINRTAQTATFTGNASSLPAATSSNQEVVMIAKRIGTSIYFMGGFVLPASGTMTLGRGGSVIDTEFLINDSSDGTKQIAFDAGGTTGTKSTIVASQTSNRSLTLPDATTTLVGTDVAQTLSSKVMQYSSADDSASTGSSVTVASLTSGIVRLTNASLVSVAGIPSGAAGRILIVENKTGNQITINNEDTGATAANRVLTGSGTNVSMPNNATFMFTYDSTASRWQLTGGSGSGSGSGGSKNYLSAIITSQSTSSNTGNGNFETGSTSGWSLFNTTLTSLIPTGSINAGAASVTTFNTVSSSQLAGSYSLQTASSAAWSAGQGFISDAFYIDNEDQNKVLTFKAYYKVVTNPSNGNFSGTSSNTFAIYIYDVTNSAWIQPAGVYGLNQNSGVGYVTGTFQTTSNSTQYRIAVLAVNASSGAITMYWDDFSVGPQTAPLGAVVTDWVAYTPTLSNITLGNGTLAAFYRRVGDSIEINFSFKMGTTSSMGTSPSFSLPNGLTFDSNKFTALNGEQTIGYGKIYDAGTDAFDAIAEVSGNNILVRVVKRIGADYLDFPHIQSTVPMTWTNGDAITIRTGLVPIVGWSSNVQMSNDTDTRVVSAILRKTSNQNTVGPASLKITYQSADNQTHGQADTTNSRINVPVSGVYNVKGTVTINCGTGNGSGYLTVYKNGVGTNYQTTIGCVNSTRVQLNINVDIPLKSGDYIELFFGTDANTFNIEASNFSLTRVSGPSTIAASESINAKATNSSTAIASVATTTIVFSSVAFDTHNLYSTSTGKYTVPVSGKYRITGAVYTNNSGTNGVSTEFRLIANQSGSVSATSTVDRQVVQTTSLIGAGMSGSALFNCLAGDLIWFTVFNGAGNTITLNNAAADNFICIERIGN